MNTDPAAAQKQSLNRGTLLLSVLFSMTSLGALLGFVVLLRHDSAIQQALAQPGDSSPVLLVFLERFGLVMPALALGLAGALIALGLRLPRQQLKDGRWAQTSLLWLMMACVLSCLVNALQLLRPANGASWQLFVPLALLLPFSVAYFWIRKNLPYFQGHERLFASQARLAWNLLIPTLLIFVFVAARPLEQTFVRSLTDKRFAGQEAIQFVGLDNYQNLLSFRFDVVSCRKADDGSCETRRDGTIRWESIDQEVLRQGFRTVSTFRLRQNRALALSGLDDDFIQSIVTTLNFTVVSVVLELALGLFIALTVNSKFVGRGFMRAVMLVPWAMPTVITARLWELMLKDTSAGIVNRLLMDLNLIVMPLAWLSTKALQIPTAIMVDVWKTAPFMALLLLAGLQTIPKELYEAASVDGANPWTRFLRITLPLLRPTIAVALVFRTLDALRVFDLFNVLFGRQQLSMATYNYEILVNNQQDGYASAISIIIFMFISLFAVLYIRMLKVET